MTINITGRDPSAAAWPVQVAAASHSAALPSGATVVPSGTIEAALNDASDSTYLQEPNPTQYYRVSFAPFTLPNRARIFYMVGTIRAKIQSVNSKRDCLVTMGDHSQAKGASKDYLPTVHFQITGAFTNYSTRNFILNSLGKPLGQDDINKGIYLVFGLNTVYAPQAVGAQFAQGYIRFQYDMPPTATITGPTPSGTVNDTSAPTISWDYFDDFQPQAKFQVNIKDHTTGAVLHDSGLIASSDTSYPLPTNLPNGTYDVNLRVYQAWGHPGGDFAATNLATSTFTVNVLKLNPPNIKINDNFTDGEFIQLLVYPDVNLLDFDASTMDPGSLAYQGTDLLNCTVSDASTPVRDGLRSMKIIMTATTGSLLSKFKMVPASPGDQFNGYSYFNPLALAGASVTTALVFTDATGAVLSTVSGSSTALPINTWTQAGVIGAIAPANTAWVQLKESFAGVVATNVLYMDDAAIYRGGSNSTRINLCTEPNNESVTTGWSNNGGNTVTLSTSTDHAQAGTKSLKMVTATIFNFGDGCKIPFTCLVGESYTVSMSVWNPSTVGSPTLGALISGVPNALITSVTRGQWERIYITFTATLTTHTLVMSPFSSSTASVQLNYYIDSVLIEQSATLGDYFDGNSVGASWTGTVNNSTSIMAGQLQAWSRGGFFSTTPNLLRDVDASIEDDSYLWLADAALANSVIQRDGTQRAHGESALMLTRSTGTGDIGAVLGTNYFIPINPSTNFKGIFSIFSTVARSDKMVISFYKSDFTPSAITATLTGSTTPTANQWTYGFGWSGTSPSDAAYFTVKLQVAGVLTTTEKHWFDSIAVYISTAPAYSGFWPGYKDPNTSDINPTLLVEYQDFGETDWTELTEFTVDNLTDHYVVNDYQCESGLGRVYRGTLLERENDIALNSDPSTPTTPYETRNFTNVWINADSDPAGTSYQFRWDGGGKSETVDAQPELVDIDGRDYAFPQFGNQYKGTVDVNIALENSNDINALQGFAKTKGTLVYRDGRGRCYRGVMGPVKMDDIQPAPLKRASFTFQVSGDQP